MDKCEVLVVGGGPAGSTCAWKLHQAGVDVMVLDKQSFPRDKICAGWITPAVADELELDLDTYAQDHTLQALTGFRIGLLGAGEVETHYGETVSYGIRRCEFDDYLLQRSGARLQLQAPLKSLHRTADGWIVNDSIQARMLVGAGGHFCPVARHLGARPGSSEPAVAAKEIEFAMTDAQAQNCPVNEAVPELFFCQDLKGYGWIFRKGNYLNIGLGRQDTQKLSSHIDAFVDYLQQRGRIPRDLPDRLHGHAYLLYGDAPRRILDDQVLLIGDAAGLAYAQSGEGIRPAIESALMAARVIQQAAGDHRAARLQPYETALEQRFGARHRRHSLALSRLLPDSLTRFLAGKLLASRWFNRHLVLDRWFFHRHQAPLKLG